MDHPTGRLTDAQKRARDWLPADGSWRSKPSRMTGALNSLALAWTGCVEYDPSENRWRFTARGVEVREAVANAR